MKIYIMLYSIAHQIQETHHNKISISQTCLIWCRHLLCKFYGVHHTPPYEYRRAHYIRLFSMITNLLFIKIAMIFVFFFSQSPRRFTPNGVANRVPWLSTNGTYREIIESRVVFSVIKWSTSVYSSGCCEFQKIGLSVERTL